MLELLAPAGNLQKLKIAFLYGADSVYVGGEVYGLRASAGNFGPEEMEEGLKLAHSLGKKLYVTLNIFARNSDLTGIRKYTEELAALGVDGVIVADPGVFTIVREMAPDLEIHVSTQANTLNSATCSFWKSIGAERVNLARELSLQEISEISKNTSGLDLEAFVHGAMCMSYSGRCLLSDYMTGRSSNRGECAHPCRWNYFLTEEKRPGEYMPVFENERGTFVFNSKDLCMIEHLPEMVSAGINCFKIEGRVKSEYYTAVVVGAYRLALDSILSGNYTFDPQWLSELETVSHREYSTGFYLGTEKKQVYCTSSYSRTADFVGIVLQCDSNGNAVVEQRNKFEAGQVVEVVTPGPSPAFSFTLVEMKNENGILIESAPHANMIVHMNIGRYVPQGSIIRRR
ncbi:MAG: U32 family peptidase [Clostridiales bacterium]|jgi:putative protease|nr:U32 family peptidase [Clostridiales bacterium]